MKNTFFAYLAAIGLIFSSAETFAGASSMNSPNSDASSTKPLSKISEVQNMPDDTMVYIQGYITQSLGDEMYVFQDDSGTMNIEIDDDLMANNTASPSTIVWIAAEVNKEGDITSLEAEEIQFMPTINSANNMNTSN